MKAKIINGNLYLEAESIVEAEDAHEWMERFNDEEYCTVSLNILEEHITAYVLNEWIN